MISINRILNLPIKQDFVSDLSVKEAKECYTLVVCILCVTWFVTSSVTMLETAILAK